MDYSNLERDLRLGESLKNGSEAEREEAKNKLIMLHLENATTLAYQCARRYFGNDYYKRKDLESAAHCGLAENAAKYDYERRKCFWPFAKSWVYKYIMEEVRQLIGHKLPSDAKEAFEKYEKAEAELLYELGRVPTNGEICERAGLKEKSLYNFRRKYDQRTFLIDSVEDGDERANRDNIVCDRAGTDPTAETDAADSKKALGVAIVGAVNQLPERDREMLLMSCGIGIDESGALYNKKEVSNKEIAKMFGVTTQCVRNAVERSRAKMKKIDAAQNGCLKNIFQE